MIQYMTKPNRSIFLTLHKIFCLDAQSRKIKAPGSTKGNGISALTFNRTKIFLAFLAKCYNTNTSSA